MGDRLPNRLARPRTPADRQRDYRRRQGKGEVVAPVIVSHAIVELLLNLRWIEAEASEDRRAVADAIRRVLSEAARNGMGDGRLPECGRKAGPR